jgi:hypothetical protein
MGLIPLDEVRRRLRITGQALPARRDRRVIKDEAAKPLDPRSG